MPGKGADRTGKGRGHFLTDPQTAFIPQICPVRLVVGSHQTRPEFSDGIRVCPTDVRSRLQSSRLVD